MVFGVGLVLRLLGVLLCVVEGWLVWRDGFGGVVRLDLPVDVASVCVGII